MSSRTKPKSRNFNGNKWCGNNPHRTSSPMMAGLTNVGPHTSCVERTNVEVVKRRRFAHVKAPDWRNSMATA